jgi:hypothetical protein
VSSRRRRRARPPRRSPRRSGRPSPRIGVTRAREEAQPAGLARRTSGSRNNPESLIDGGAITESAKHTYRHTLKNHVRDTKLAWREERQVHRCGGRRRVRERPRCRRWGKAQHRPAPAEGLRASPPAGPDRGEPALSRAAIDVPSKKRRVRGAIQVLEPDELRALASAAASERDRLIVKVMGYGGLRGR